jgi:hypothetical protein
MRPHKPKTKNNNEEERNQMVAKTDTPQGKSQPPAPAAGGQAKSQRKAWTPKTPVEVVLEQIARQEKKVSELREELKKEESTLTRLNQAKKVLEAT